MFIPQRADQFHSFPSIAEQLFDWKTFWLVSVKVETLNAKYCMYKYMIIYIQSIYNIYSFIF